MEHRRRLCRPDLVRPCRLLRHRRLYLDHPAGDLRLEPVARLASRHGGGRHRGLGHRRAVLSRRPARLLLRPDHAGLRRGLPHPRQLAALHPGRARHPDQGRPPADQLPVQGPDLGLLPRLAALPRLARDRLAPDPQPLRRAPGGTARERGCRAGAGHRRLRREGEGADPVGGDVRRRRHLLCTEVPLYRSLDRLRRRQVGRDAAGQHGGRRRHDLRTIDRRLHLDGHQRGDALAGQRRARPEERAAAQPRGLRPDAGADRRPPAERAGGGVWPFKCPLRRAAGRGRGPVAQQRGR